MKKPGALMGGTALRSKSALLPEVLHSTVASTSVPYGDKARVPLADCVLDEEGRDGAAVWRCNTDDKKLAATDKEEVEREWHVSEGEASRVPDCSAASLSCNQHNAALTKWLLHCACLLFASDG